MKFKLEIDAYLDKLKGAIDRLSREEIDGFMELLLSAHERDACIFIMGNGGSASTAGHFVCDMNKGISYGMKKRFRVISLADNQATMMAYANDVSYDDIFVEPLKNFLRPGDLVIGISGSGNSKNVLRAIEFANENGGVTVGLTGYNGGRLRQIAQHSVNANIDDMQVSEDLHMIVVHIAMQIGCSVLKGTSQACQAPKA